SAAVALPPASSRRATEAHRQIASRSTFRVRRDSSPPASPFETIHTAPPSPPVKPESPALRPPPNSLRARSSLPAQKLSAPRASQTQTLLRPPQISSSIGFSSSPS